MTLPEYYLTELLNIPDDGGTSGPQEILASEWKRTRETADKARSDKLE